MDAPQGRYRVIEKDGRLVVIDNRTGAPASSPVVPPPRMGGRGGPVQSASPVTAAKSGLDTFADMLLRLVVREWDAEGRAVIHWEWKEGGKERSWDALLDLDQQRRLGRALVHFAVLPVLILLLMFAGGSWVWLAFVLGAYPLFR